ncbi:MAG: ROK family protein [Gammaproteobacteria bacterium]
MRVGVDLGGTKIEGIVVADSGEINDKLRIDTPAQDYEQTVAAVCDVVSRLQASLDTPATVGIGTPGALDQHGLMKNSNSVCLNGRPLKQDLETILAYPIRIENDANCFALSEAHYGAGRNARSVFGVILGTGTGGGIVIEGNLLTGPNSIAGEWGHNNIPVSVRELIEADRQCYCGRRNCIETVLSGRGLKQTFQDRWGQSMDAMRIAELARAGDAAANACIDLYCKQLARCLATVVNLIDPEVIVLGGGLSNIDALYDSVPSYMEAHVFTEGLLTRLTRPGFGDASGALGAACLWPRSQPAAQTQ